MTAPELDVLLDSGETVPLRQLYASQPVVLVFLRHFGCTFCREHVAQLRVHDKLNVVFVAMANPEQTREFKKKMRSPHTFICDPDRTLYQAFGLQKGEGKQMFNPRVFARGFGATLRGHFVGLPIGDPWQMPGMFKVETSGEVSWEYRSVDAADNASAGEIVCQLTSH